MPDGTPIEGILESFWMARRKPDQYPGLYEDLVAAWGPEDAFRLKYPSHGTGTQQREAARLRDLIVDDPPPGFVDPWSRGPGAGDPVPIALKLSPIKKGVIPFAPVVIDQRTNHVPSRGDVTPAPLPFVPPIEKPPMANIPAIVPQQVSIAGIIGGVKTVAGWITGGGTAGPTMQPPQSCPTGYVLRNGVCERVGVVGAVQRILPGGQTGVVPAGAQIGQAVMGQYGPALVPTELARSISKCIRGMVLGSDGLCYNKRDISNKERLWPRGTRPLLSGGDRKTLRKARSIENQLGRLGMIPPKPKKKRKKLVHKH